MHGDVDVAAAASLLADPTRATFLMALCDGRSLPAGELAHLARVAPSTASAHLSELVGGGILKVETSGRHRYYRLSGPEVARAIEALALVAPTKPVRSLRQSRDAGAIRFARTCYDHLAGLLGVRFTEALVERDVLLEAEEGYELTAEGLSFLRDFGVDLSPSTKRRRYAPRHVDWSERYHHFAGPLAKATTARLFELEWIQRKPSSRAVRLTRMGEEGLQEHFGLNLDVDEQTDIHAASLPPMCSDLRL